MAAATGYGDAPTGEELIAYADLPRYGHDMAEVFSVRVPDAAGGRRPPPCGTISFHGGHCCSDLIYSRRRPDEPTSPIPCDIQGNIVLTGPSVAISAYGPVIFNLRIHDGSQEDEDDNVEEENTGRIFCDTVGGEFSDYDRAIVETVSTRYGPAEVTYAVLTNAVQGQVAVKLARRHGQADPTAAAAVLGRIISRSKLLDAGCVLFYNESDSITRAGPDELIPLARHVLAAPLLMPLTIELDLCSSSGDEIFRGVVEFKPAVNGEHMERVIGIGGDDIEVTISWSDFPW
ncbi:hypothetical protein E2562_016589 [Oryza meyeriana var. granulata]|uniref:DUF6598 domain-containing protein n=1 Tax=Oryza meyeriana var. granulata TaxID=110450 RepID=A0A6G1C754_9ORYZ|nr:hypothetical protein E2562_016589 [Oryza meyeriana var. granulata]